MTYELSTEMSAETNLSTETQAPLSQGRERRATLHALNVWNRSRDEDGIAKFARLMKKSNPMDEQETLSENQFLILFEPNSQESIILFYGNQLPKIMVERGLGNSLQQTLPPALKDTFVSACMEAVENGDATHRQGTINTPSGEDVLYRSIFMPLRTGDRYDRTYILGVFSNEDGGAELLAAA